MLGLNKILLSHLTALSEMYILQVSVQNRNEDGGCQPVSSDSSIHTSTPEPRVLTGGHSTARSLFHGLQHSKTKIHPVKANENNVK